MTNRTGEPSSITSAMARHRGALISVGLFSGLINILALSGSLYMLQVYDRVLPSRSVPTLVGLTVLMVILYAGLGLLDLVRVRVMARIGLKIDRALGGRILEAVMTLPLRAKPTGGDLLPIRDLDQIRSFLSGLGPTALFDLPWLPVYLAMVFVLHPWLGAFATASAGLLIVLTLLTELRTSRPGRAATASGAARMTFAEAARRNAEVVQAMGMQAAIGRAWAALNARHLGDQLGASDAASGLGAASKVLRLMLQSGMLGLGAWLAVRGEISAGTIIAGTIILSRALAPVELAISHWRSFVAARQGYARLKALFKSLPPAAQTMALPRPSRSLKVDNLTVAAPGQPNPILRGISFALEAGAGLGVIGPSAAGKSTLARALAGVWLPLPRGGSVRLDGATLDQYDPHALGRDIGYLPQSIELFDETVARNIARLEAEPASDAVIKAARLAGVHDMILALPDGYNTRIGDGGTLLSAGQRQRIALARALYGDPFLVVLDEPNSNLDTSGDAALTDAIKSVRVRGGIVIVIAHRPSAIGAVDQLLALANGQVQAFGPKEEVLRAVLAPARGNLSVVADKRGASE